jgi:tripartite-type tricarboxylate transporter receptor subunit TctC
VYKSNFDAFVDMAGGHGVNFILERIHNYEGFKDKNKNLQMLSMSCPARHPSAPAVKTLSEYGINSPFIWQQLVASKNMSPTQITEFRAIFSRATKNIGLAQIQQLSDQTPPVFNNVDSTTHYYQSLDKLKSYREKYKNDIEASR